MDASHFRELASRDHPPGAHANNLESREAKMQAQIAALTAQIEELSRPSQEGRDRASWNRDDAGPPQSDEALVGGAAQLDKQGATPLQAELVAGPTRALITRQPVQPSPGAWEAAPRN